MTYVLKQVLEQFPEVMEDKPGKTSIVEMGIQIEEGTRTDCTQYLIG